MIDPQDWMLVAVLVGFAIVLTSLLWIGYNSALVWELKREHQRELETMNAEIIMVRGKLAKGEMQARVMGGLPVSRLIGEDE